MNVEKLQKLWNLATRNPNENEALVAARKFVRAINREQVSVHLYKGAAPASQEQIQRAIDNAYQKGINDLKADYQRQLDRHLNAKYNEGYLDGQRNGYTEEDMKRQYPNVLYRIGDVKDINSIRNAIEDYKPHVVINTAALKHVPICETNSK